MLTHNMEKHLSEAGPDDERYPVRRLYGAAGDLMEFFGIEKWAPETTFDLLRETRILLDAYEECYRDYLRKCENDCGLETDYGRDGKVENIFTPEQIQNRLSFHANADTYQ